MKLLSLLTTGLLAAALASCNSPDQPLPGHTRAWLHDTHGATLRFGRPGTTVPDEVQVELAEVNAWHSHPGKFSLGGWHQEEATLRYLSRDASQGTSPTGLLVRFNATGRVYFWPELSSTYLPPVAEVLTSDTATDELASSTQSQATVELLTNTTLNGRPYARVVHLRMLNAPGSTSMQDYWYSKAEGLVAYTAANGQTWYRL